MSNVRWTLYPQVAASCHAKAWIEIQAKLLRAPKTIDAYARSINDFLVRCSRLHIDIVSATRRDMAEYVNDLVNHQPARRLPDQQEFSGLANSTIQLRLTAVRLFYDYLIECGDCKTNPVGRGRYTPRTGFYSSRTRGLVPRFQKAPWIPTEAEWSAFVGVLLREDPLRNQLMTYIAYDGALRRSELLSLALSDFDFSNFTIRIRPEIAKNKSGRLVCYSDATSELLCAYVRRRQARFGQNNTIRRGPLFISESRRNYGAPLSVEMWNKIVQRVARHADLPKFSTHTFRHLRLTDLARCKLDLHEIATYAGHKNLKTTHDYIRWSSTDLVERVREATRYLDEKGLRMLERHSVQQNSVRAVGWRSQ